LRTRWGLWWLNLSPLIPIPTPFATLLKVVLPGVSHGRALGTPHHIDDAKVLPCPVTALAVRADIAVLFWVACPKNKRLCKVVF